MLEASGKLSAKLPEVEEEAGGRLVGRSGEGEAEVELHARNDLSLKIRGSGESRGPDLGFDADFAAQIEAQIAESLGAIDIDALAQREIEKAMRKAEREIEKARRKAEHGRHHIEGRIRHAQERAARAARRAQERVSRRSHRWARMPETSYLSRPL